jgi:hypothetical protein
MANLPGGVNPLYGKSEQEILALTIGMAGNSKSKLSTVQQAQQDNFNEVGAAAMSALAQGRNPMDALSGLVNQGRNDTFANLPGLISAGFNTHKIGPDGKPMLKSPEEIHADKIAMKNGAINAAGYLAVDFAASRMGGHAQLGSTIGGAVAGMMPMMFGAALMPFAGPIGALAGALIGSLFGNKKPRDLEADAYWKRQLELLGSIDKKLTPVTDWFQFRVNSFNSASMYYGGRNSLGLAMSVGAG